MPLPNICNYWPGVGLIPIRYVPALVLVAEHSRRIELFLPVCPFACLYLRLIVGLSVCRTIPPLSHLPSIILPSRGKPGCAIQQAFLIWSKKQIFFFQHPLHLGPIGVELSVFSPIATRPCFKLNGFNESRVQGFGTQLRFT